MTKEYNRFYEYIISTKYYGGFPVKQQESANHMRYTSLLRWQAGHETVHESMDY
jgi:hypothetical protein